MFYKKTSGAGRDTRAALRRVERRWGSGGRAQAGLTLIEILIALALIGFVLLAIAPLFLTSIKSNRSGNEYTSVNTMARDRLEQLMNRTFLDGELAVGVYSNDQPAYLPDPTDPTKLSQVPNPFTVTYQVSQWRADTTCPPPYSGCTGPPTGEPFVPCQVTAAGKTYQYKRIDVTVQSATGLLGIGSRMARVAGYLANPAPEDPNYFSGIDDNPVGTPCSPQ